MTDRLTGFQANHNLPLPLNHFIGRERELEEVQKLLSICRLLTLTGPSGCGKTRLAVETARSLEGSYPQGVWLVDLSLIEDPQQVFLSLASTLNVTAEGEQPLEVVILNYLRPRQMLIILDNCEHVAVEAGRAAVSILSTAQAVKVIATSQVRLEIPGEVEWIVPSLSMPEGDQETIRVDDLRLYAAPNLFTERAAEVQPGFSLNQTNISTVLEICRRLDGIPLALELAAARVKMLSLEEICTRMDDRFSLLVGSRRVVSRHQTLQAAIDWSYGLLNQPQQSLLNRLAVFRGSWTLEAAEEVCAKTLGNDRDTPASDVLQLLGELVDRSLVKVVSPSDPTGATRYRLLESVRIYAQARVSTPEQAELRLRHLTWYTHCARLADRHIRDAEQIGWIQALEEDLPNSLAAIEWAVQAPSPDTRLLLGLQLTTVIAWFSRGRSSGDLVNNRLQALLNQAVETQGPDWTAARAQAQYTLARYFWLKGNLRLAQRMHESTLALWASLGDDGRLGYAFSINHLGFCLPAVENMQAIAYHREALSIFEETGNIWGEAEATFHLGTACITQEDKAQAKILYDHALALFRQVGDRQYQGFVNNNLFNYYFLQGQVAVAESYNREMQRCFSELNFMHGLNLSLNNQGILLLSQGLYVQAEETFRQAMVFAEKTGVLLQLAQINWRISQVQLFRNQFSQAAQSAQNAIRISSALELDKDNIEGWIPWFALFNLAAAVSNQHKRLAARMHGKALDEIQKIGEPMLSQDILPAGEILKRVRGMIGEKVYAEAQAEGVAMNLEELLAGLEADAQRPADPIPSQPLTPLKAEKARFSGLTAREREVAVFIAQGYSNPAIAARMTLSERTVTTHVSNILTKLGYTSRTQIAAWVVEKGLLSPSEH